MMTCLTRWLQPQLASVRSALAALLIVGAGPGCTGRGYADGDRPPEPPREFRGLWVATVANINWPSEPGLPAQTQKAELAALIQNARQQNFNAIILQVRPAGDTFYPSELEPWSEYLTGASGKPPEPFYDPLRFAIDEAHAYGMELHAWINPFRARHSSATTPAGRKHISRQHPKLVKRYGSLEWMDPGEPLVRKHTQAVIEEIVGNYDIDGLHMDDYFYPYRDAGVGDFPDTASWNRYLASDGRLSRDDWRRKNVNDFIQETYYQIKRLKPWVKVGISPFGIWRPGYPPQIQGRDNFAEEYADTRLWLMSGWLDYCAPQLYWPIAQSEQSFPALLGWWTRQNPQGRHLWPGLNATNIRLRGWQTDEILNQIDITRRYSGAQGVILYNADAVASTTDLAERLQNESFGVTALVPHSPWLSRRVPKMPWLESELLSDGYLLQWDPRDPDIHLWVYQERLHGSWTTRILPKRLTERRYDMAALPDLVAISSVNRFGAKSRPVFWRLEDERNAP